jgi:hypothetical protein
MDQLFDQLLRRETIYLAFFVVIVTFFIRRIVETAVPSAKGVENGHKGATYKTKFGLWWNSVILYAIPVLLGAGVAILAFGSDYLPEDLKTRAGAGMWGAVIGWCSSFIYKVTRKFLKKKTGVDLTPGPAEPDKKDSEKPPAKDDDEDEEEEAPESEDEAPESGKDEEDEDEDTKDEDKE